VAEPFLRWAGGKRWLARQLTPLLRERLRGRYIEPFLGSGAMFFALSPRKALLSDLNADLINAFQLVADQPQKVLDAIRLLRVDANTYYQLRKQEPSALFERAVRFIYLNRTCYGGLYRENKAGCFNVPYGGGSRTPDPLWDRNILMNAHEALALDQIDFRVSDFEEALEKACVGDVVYCDPTFRGASRNQFDRYGKVVFGWQDHVRLAAAVGRARDRGSLVLVSNSSCDQIGELYPDGVKIHMFKSKSIGNKSKNHERQREVLIVLDPERSQCWSRLDWACGERDALGRANALSLRLPRPVGEGERQVPKENDGELTGNSAVAA
jgi:DNA adenine methylase